MPTTAILIAFAMLTASSSQLLARGGQAGPIGPGSRDGLTPGVNDYRADPSIRGPFAYERQTPAPKPKRTIRRK